MLRRTEMPAAVKTPGLLRLIVARSIDVRCAMCEEIAQEQCHGHGIDRWCGLRPTANGNRVKSADTHPTAIGLVASPCEPPFDQQLPCSLLRAFSLPILGSLSNVIAHDCTLIGDSRATSFDEIYLP
jgi:hypothetical protein